MLTTPSQIFQIALAVYAEVEVLTLVAIMTWLVICVSQSWMESDIFSLSICGAHVWHRGGREEAHTSSFGAHKKAWRGWLFLFTVNYHKTAFSMISIIPPSIMKSISSVKTLEKNSDLKTQESFEAVIDLLKSCKDGASERIFR